MIPFWLLISPTHEVWHQHVIVWTRMSITTKLSKAGYQLEYHMTKN